MAPCMSAAIACRDLLADLGKWPSSLTMPPRCPPMPSAQVLQAFLERMAFQSFENAAGLAGLSPSVKHRRPAAACFVGFHGCTDTTSRYPFAVVQAQMRVRRRTIIILDRAILRSGSSVGRTRIAWLNRWKLRPHLGRFGVKFGRRARRALRIGHWHARLWRMVFRHSAVRSIVKTPAS